MKEKKEAPSEKLKTLTNKILWFRNHFSTAMDLTQPLTVGNTEFKKRVEEIKDFFEYLEKLKDDFNELKKEFIEIVKPNITDEELHNGIKEQIRLKE
jgi:t-SNARE complex subunit (syntaxin)